MERVRAYFDSRFGKKSLNSALTLLMVWSSYFSLGILGIVKYSMNGDQVGFYLGVANTTIGIFGIFSGSQTVHAVVRRLVAESRYAP